MFVIYKEIYEQVLSVVESVTGVNREQMLSASRAEECVEARIMLVYWLLDAGLRDKQIMELTKMSKQQIIRARQVYGDKLQDNYFRNMTEWVRKEVQSIADKVEEKYEVKLKC